MRIEDLKFINNNDNIFSIQAYFPIGNIHEKIGEYGISHFLEHMKLKKSNKYNKYLFNEELDKSIVRNAYTTKDHTSYYLRGNMDKWKILTNLMYEIIFNTSFNKKDIEIEKKIILEEKLITNGNYEKNDIDFNSEISILDKKNPYSKRVIGKMEDIKKITNIKLINYNKKYINDYLIIITCNNKFKQKIKKLCFELFPDALKKPTIKLENTQSFNYSMTLRNIPTPQNKCYLTFKSFSESDNNKYYVNFIKNFLVSGMNSILMKKLRIQKGYTYSINTYEERYKDYGCFRIFIYSNNTNSITEILEIIFNELNILKKKGLIKTKLIKNKEKYLDSIDYYFKNNDYLVNNYGKYLYYDRTFTIKKYKKIIMDMTNEKLIEILNILFDYNKMGLVSYGNYPKIEKTKNNIMNIITKNRKIIII